MCCRWLSLVELSLKCALCVHFRNPTEVAVPLVVAFSRETDVGKGHEPSPVPPSFRWPWEKQLFCVFVIKTECETYHLMLGACACHTNVCSKPSLEHVFFFSGCFLKSSIMFSLHYQQYLLTDVCILVFRYIISMRYFSYFYCSRKNKYFSLTSSFYSLLLCKEHPKWLIREKFGKTFCRLRLSNVYL